MSEAQDINAAEEQKKMASYLAGKTAEIQCFHNGDAVIVYRPKDNNSDTDSDVDGARFRKGEFTWRLEHLFEATEEWRYVGWSSAMP